MKKRWSVLALLATCSARSLRAPRVAEPTRDDERLRYFGGISFAGATACSVTHGLVVPLDVSKRAAPPLLHSIAAC